MSEPGWLAFGRVAAARLAQLHRPERAAATPASGERRAPSETVRDEPDGEMDLASWDAARGALATSLGDDSAFATLAANAQLGAHEAEVLAVALSCEVDERCHRLVAYSQGDAAPSGLSLASLPRLFGADHRGARAVGPGSILQRSGLLALTELGPWYGKRIAIHPTVVWALVGDHGPDPDLPAGVEVARSTSPGRSSVVVVTGADRQRRRQAGADAAMGERFLVCRAPDEPAAWQAIVREATIVGGGVIVEADGGLTPDGLQWVERADHLSWVISSRLDLPVEQLPSGPWTAVTAAGPTPTDEEWAALMPGVARTHRLSFDQLDEVARVLDACGGDFDAAVRRLVAGRLDKLARRIRPTRSWGDVVLSPDRIDLLRSIVERYRYADRIYDDWGFQATPSRGLVALFSGPSGTGKTLAAEIVAGELGLDVFKLDLSAVVSKYIGETEKNLEEVFDAASAGNLLLFFDEADSLFGKRSEVRDARDRYANIEVSYLLQRLEAYDGLVVMATNFERNIDDAFLRRIHTRIEFAIPGVVERALIWRHNLPASAPVDGIDVDWLAERFDLSGGSIRNVAVNAAFVAASSGTAIDMRCAVIGVAREQRKLGRLLKPDDFGEYASYVDPA